METLLLCVLQREVCKAKKQRHKIAKRKFHFLLVVFYSYCITTTLTTMQYSWNLMGKIRMDNLKFNKKESK